MNEGKRVRGHNIYDSIASFIVSLCCEVYKSGLLNDVMEEAVYFSLTGLSNIRL